MQIVKFDVKLSVIGLRFKVKWSNIEQCLILLKSLHWSNFISRDWSRVCGSWSQNIHNIRPGGVKHGVQRQHFTDNQHLLGNYLWLTPGPWRATMWGHWWWSLHLSHWSPPTLWSAPVSDLWCWRQMRQRLESSAAAVSGVRTSCCTSVTLTLTLVPARGIMGDQGTVRGGVECLSPAQDWSLHWLENNNTKIKNIIIDIRHRTNL